MVRLRSLRLVPLALLVAAASLSAFNRLSAAPVPAQATTPFARALPAMDGSKLNVRVVEVRYGPGQSSQPHKHGCAVMVYVVKGAVRMAVRGEPDSVYKAGQVFFERPTDIHQVGANASATDSAVFTATFVCDHPGPYTTPVPSTP